jgi:hypothetical protein
VVHRRSIEKTQLLCPFIMTVYTAVPLPSSRIAAAIPSPKHNLCPSLRKNGRFLFPMFVPSLSW